MIEGTFPLTTFAGASVPTESSAVLEVTRLYAGASCPPGTFTNAASPGFFHVNDNADAPVSWKYSTRIRATCPVAACTCPHRRCGPGPGTPEIDDEVVIDPDFRAVVG